MIQNFIHLIIFTSRIDGKTTTKKNGFSKHVVNLAWQSQVNPTSFVNFKLHKIPLVKKYLKGHFSCRAFIFIKFQLMWDIFSQNVPYFKENWPFSKKTWGLELGHSILLGVKTPTPPENSSIIFRTYLPWVTYPDRQVSGNFSIPEYWSYKWIYKRSDMP